MSGSMGRILELGLLKDLLEYFRVERNPPRVAWVLLRKGFHGINILCLDELKREGRVDAEGKKGVSVFCDVVIGKYITKASFCSSV